MVVPMSMPTWLNIELCLILTVSLLIVCLAADTSPYAQFVHAAAVSAMFFNSDVIPYVVYVRYVSTLSEGLVK